MAEGTVEIEVDGKTYKGTWRTEDGMVSVSSPSLGTKTTQIGGSPPGSLARIMLGELVNDKKLKR